MKRGRRLLSAVCTCCTFFLSYAAFAQVTQEGIAYYYDYQKKEKTPLASVSIAVVNAQPELSREDGAFTLRFSKKEVMGNKIVLSRQPECRGLKVFNQSIVDNWHIIREPLELIMCKYSDYELSKQFFFNEGYRSAEQEYLKREAEGRGRIDQQHDMRSDSYIQRLDENADKLARVDRSVLGENIREIFDEYDNGLFEKAINHLRALKLPDRLIRLADERKKAPNRSYKQDKEFSSLARDIRIAASLLENQARWEEAEHYLKVLADIVGTTEDYFTYASFCFHQNRLKEARDYYQILLEKISDSSEYPIEKCSALTRIGIILLSMDYPDEAKSYLEDALNMASTLYSKPSYETQRCYVASLVYTGDYYQYSKEFKQGEKYYLRAEEIAREDIDKKSRILVAKVLGHIADYYINNGFPEKAMAYSSLARDTFVALSEESNGIEDDLRADVLVSYVDVARSYIINRDYEAAEKILREVLTETEKLSEQNLSRYGYYYAQCIRMLGVVYELRYKYADAIDCYRKAIEAYKRNDPQSSEYNLDEKYYLLRSYANLLVNINPSGEETKVILHEFLTLVNKRAERISSDLLLNVIDMKTEIGMLYLHSGGITESEQNLLEALALLNEVSADTVQYYLTGQVLYNKLAHLYWEKGDKETARFYFQKELAFARNCFQFDESIMTELVDALNDMGWFELRCGNYEESNKYLLESRNLCFQGKESYNANLTKGRLISTAYLMQSYHFAGNTEAEARMSNEFLEMVSEVDVPDNLVFTVAEVVSVASSYVGLNYEVVAPFLKKTLATLDEMEFISHDLINTYVNCCHALCIQAGEEELYSDAEKYAQASVSLVKKHINDVGAEDLLIDAALGQLAIAYYVQQKTAEIMNLFSANFVYIRDRTKSLLAGRGSVDYMESLITCYFMYAYSAIRENDLSLAESLFNEVLSLLSELSESTPRKEAYLIDCHVGLAAVEKEKGKSGLSHMIQASSLLNAAFENGLLTYFGRDLFNITKNFVLLELTGETCLNERQYDQGVDYFSAVLQILCEDVDNKYVLERAVAEWELSLCYGRKRQERECWYYVTKAAMDYQKLYKDAPDVYAEIYNNTLRASYEGKKFFECADDLSKIGEQLIAIGVSEKEKADIHLNISERYLAEGKDSLSLSHLQLASLSKANVYNETKDVNDLNEYISIVVQCIIKSKNLDDIYSTGKAALKTLLSSPQFDQASLPDRLDFFLLLAQTCLRKTFIEEGKEYLYQYLSLSERFLVGAATEDIKRTISQYLFLIDSLIEKGEHELSLEIAKKALNIVLNQIDSDASFYEYYERVSFHLAGELKALGRNEESMEALYALVAFEHNQIEKGLVNSTTNLSIALKDAIEQIRTSKNPIAVGQDCHDAIVQLYSLPDSVLFNDSDSSIDALLSSAQVLNNTVWEEERNLCMETALRVIDSTEMNQRRFRVSRFKLLIVLGQMYQGDSLASRALENYMKAESLYSSLATSEREDLKAEYVSTCINIFNLLESSSYADAIVYVEKAVRVMEGLEKSIDTEDLFLMYEMMATLYQYYMDSGHEELAAEYGKKAMQVCPLFSPGWNKDTLKDLAEFMLKLGEFQYSTERYEDAVQTYELFIRRFYDPQKAHSDVVNRAYYAILSRMESMYTSLSRSADAERVKKTMISIEEKKNNTSVQTHQ